MKDKSSVESRLHELHECSEDGLILLDLADEVGASALNARVAYVNPAACALLGLESDCNQDDILAKLERNVRFMGSGGSIRDLLRSEVPWCADVSLPHGADGRQAYRLRASPVFNGLAIMLDRPWFSGAVPGQAADPDAPMDTLIHYLAHELRTPLAGISNAQFILGSLAADAPRAEQARAIGERQSRHLVQVLDNLLDALGADDIGGFLVPERIDVGALIDASLTGASHELDHRQIRVERREQPWSPCVRGDQVRLARLFELLMRFLAAELPERCAVSIDTRAVAARVFIDLRFSGVALSASSLARLRALLSDGASSVPNLSVNGPGIESYLMQRILRAHGGSMRWLIDAASGKPDGLSIELPGCAAESQTATIVADRERDAGERTLARRLSILVVEDDDDARDSLMILLGMNGHGCMGAQSVASAITTFQRERPQVIILDLALPDGNGLEVARRIREMPGGAEPVLIALSGFGRPGDITASLAAGIDCHLTKPATVAELFDAIEQCRR